MALLPLTWQNPEYKGTGDLKNAENWTCEEPDPEKH
jgi:hypothetical protein